MILKGHSEDVTEVAYTYDGKKILTSSLDRTIKVWDAESGKCLKTKTESSPISCISVSKMGMLAVFGNEDGSVKAWNFE